MKKFFSFFLALNFTLSAQTQNLDSKLSQIFTSKSLVGMSVVVFKDTSIAYIKHMGKRDIARNLNVDDNTYYRIASISKTITALAVMILADEGYINVKYDASRYLGFTLRNPNFPNDSITVEALLTHTSSLRDGSSYDSFLSATYNQNLPPTLSSLLVNGGAYYSTSNFASIGPKSKYFTYANINYGILGTIVEKVSKIRFDIFCRNKIFIPLNLDASFNIQDLSNINNLAVLYRKNGSSWQPQTDNYQGVKPPARDLSSYQIGTNGFIFAPQGGLRISAKDLTKIFIMLSNYGFYNNKRIISSAKVQEMFNQFWNYNGSNGDNYYGIFNAYGYAMSKTQVLLQTQTLYGHPGEAYGLISDAYFSLNPKYGIIFITNGGSWGNGKYSGWYDVEEEVYTAIYSEINNITTVEKNINVNSNFEILSIYPNPFNPSATILFQATNSNNLTANVYDIRGVKLFSQQIENNNNNAQSITINLNSFSSGNYIIEITNGIKSSRKIATLIK
jgi:CubicO group peptidase (beta-lactamase class C family)